MCAAGASGKARSHAEGQASQAAEEDSRADDGGVAQRGGAAGWRSGVAQRGGAAGWRASTTAVPMRTHATMFAKLKK